jgi:hypothetical protein
MITKKPNKKIIIIVVLVLAVLLLSSIASVLTSFFWSDKKKPKSKPVDGPGNGVVAPPGGGVVVPPPGNGAVVVPPGNGAVVVSPPGNGAVVVPPGNGAVVVPPGDGVGSGYVFSDNNDGPIGPLGSSVPLIPGEPECQVHFYRDTGFRDIIAVLGNGEYREADLNKIPNMINGGHSSVASSIRITGDNRCKVQLFHGNYWMLHGIGDYTLNRSDKYPFISDLTNTGPQNINYNDRIGALRIWAPLPPSEDNIVDVRDARDNELCELTLFDGTGNNKYSGSTFYRSITKSTGGELFDLDIENNFDDNTEAVYLRGKGCVLDMSENTGYSGGTSRVTVPQGKSDIMFRLDKNDPIEGFIYNGSVRENQMGSYKVGTVSSPPVNTNPTNTTNTTSRKLRKGEDCASNIQCQSNDCGFRAIRARKKTCK